MDAAIQFTAGTTKRHLPYAKRAKAYLMAKSLVGEIDLTHTITGDDVRLLGEYVLWLEQRLDAIHDLASGADLTYDPNA